MVWKIRLVFALIFGACAVLAAVPPVPLFVLADPSGDDRGPGSYIYPTGSEYRPGDFDLRSFSVRVEGSDAVFEVTLGAKVQRNIVQQRTEASDLDLNNGIYTQNVDIYIDSTPGTGYAEALPGRQVRFPPQSGWETVIAIVPRPSATKAELRHWNAQAAVHVVTPGPVTSNGPTLTVRVPLSQLGGVPQKSWGYSVMVSGASWEKSFAVFDRLRKTYKSDGFTLPVYGVAEERAFGGGHINSGNPFIADVILPPGISQESVLGAYTSEAFAVVPMVYPDGHNPVASSIAPLAPGTSGVAQVPTNDTAGTTLPRAPAELRIASRDKDTLVIPAPSGHVRLWQLGTVVDDKGNTVGRVVVTLVSNTFVIATLTEGQGTVRPGQEVRFVAPK